MKQLKRYLWNLDGWPDSPILLGYEPLDVKWFFEIGVLSNFLRNSLYTDT